MAIQRTELIDIPNYEEIKKNFLKELVLASQNKPSSISFLKHYPPEKPLVTEGILQIFVIGGTNYTVEMLEIKPDGKRKIISKQTGILPIFTTKQILIEFFSLYIDAHVDAIGINFGFPLVACTGSKGELDGILVHGTKEHTFAGLTQPLGELVKVLFKKKFHKTPLVAVANDTICLTLAGSGTEQGALVVGTGSNMCLTMQEKKGKILVNLECGNFNKFIIAPVIKKLDERSENPGSQLFEKNISGQYLSGIFNEIIKNFPEIQPVQTSKKLSMLAKAKTGGNASNIARTILTRSASLVASEIAAVYEFLEKPEKFSLIAEGGLLWNGWHYQENIRKQLIKLGLPQNAVTIKHIQNSGSNGTIGLITK
jgi:hexokinase